MNIYHLNINRFNYIDLQNIKECYYLPNEDILNERITSQAKVIARERIKVSLITYRTLFRFIFLIIIIIIIKGFFTSKKCRSKYRVYL
jgi:hypothetical protein